MRYICSNCDTRIAVNSITVERAHCPQCNKYTEGYTVPECSDCGDYDIQMVQTDNDLYTCPQCFKYRSSDDSLLTKNGNPTTICPICMEPKRFRELEKSHWHYSDQPGYEEVYIQICKDCHVYIHDETTLTEQERYISDLDFANGHEVALFNLVSLDMRRIDIHHKYHPYKSNTLHLEYVLTRYCFPTYLDSYELADVFNLSKPQFIPEELTRRRKRVEEERRNNV